MDDLTTIREQATQHQRELDARARYYTVRQLAARWACSSSSVRAIPAARLPYAVIGNGIARAHRRYNPDDVRAYELGRESAA